MQQFAHIKQRQDAFPFNPSNLPRTTNKFFNFETHHGHKSPVSPKDSVMGEGQNIWGLGKTPIKVSVLSKYLADYPNKHVANKLLSGFSEGFYLHFSGPRTHIDNHNLVSAYQHPRELLKKIQTEVALGRVAGPFKKLRISNLRISPIGIVPKGNNTGWRLITYLSFPQDNSMNSFIAPSECTV